MGRYWIEYYDPAKDDFAVFKTYGSYSDCQTYYSVFMNKFPKSVLRFTEGGQEAPLFSVLMKALPLIAREAKLEGRNNARFRKNQAYHHLISTRFTDLYEEAQKALQNN
jgi:hypothetical protein